MKPRAWIKGGMIVVAGLLLLAAIGCRNRTEGVKAEGKAEGTKAPAPTPELAIVEVVSRPDDEFDLPLRLETLEKYELTAGASVEVENFNGRVDIDPADGEQAEVYLVRSARGRDDFKDRKMTIEHQADRLSLRMERERRSVMFQIFNEHGNERQRLILRLPKRIALRLAGSGGRVHVGEFDGSLKLDGVRGRIEAVRATGSTEIEGINGTLKLIVNELKGSGVKIDGVNGRIEVQCSPGLNADVAVDAVNGRISTDLPGFVAQGERRRGGLEGRIGKGGARIEISGVNGGVSFGPVGAGSNDENAPKVVNKVLKTVGKEPAKVKPATVK